MGRETIKRHWKRYGERDYKEKLEEGWAERL
jgi:hypothetical protein